MFERPQTGERAILVHPEFGKSPDPATVEEFRMLAQSAGAEEIEQVLYSRPKAESRFFNWARQGRPKLLVLLGLTILSLFFSISIYRLAKNAISNALANVVCLIGPA